MKTRLFCFLIFLCLIAMFPHTAFAQDTRPMVRLVYFLPKDRQPQPDIDAKMDRVIKDVQEYFADQMERHGFGRKTFQIETDPSGKAVVHRFVGQFTDEHYRSTSDFSDILGEVYKDKGFTAFKHIYVNVFEIDSEIRDSGGCHNCLDAVGGVGAFTGPAGGYVLVPVVSAHLGVIAHELGHAFGLQHDFRGGAYIMSYSGIADGLSKDAAEWLDAHRAFNGNRPAVNFNTTIEMLPPSFVSPPNGIRFRFRISDPDGLHQGQLLTPTLSHLSFGFPELLESKKLNEKQDSIVEFVTTDLIPKTRYVQLQTIDAHGNFTRSEEYPIDVAALLPPAKVINIPDANLAVAVRQSLNLSSSQPLTSHVMLDLLHLNAPNSGITDLRGLEYANNLIRLGLSSEFIEGKGSVNSNVVSDLSPLMDLRKLIRLGLSSNPISDVSALSKLTKLESLDLSHNPISDVSALSKLTKLETLNLYGNSISDVSPLAKLTQLKKLNLQNNSISDISPLGGLTQHTQLNVTFNPINYASLHTHIPAMQAEGIQVYFDKRRYPALDIISGLGQQATGGETLANPLIVAAIDASGRPMPGVRVTFSVTQGNGDLSTTTATTDANGRAETIFTLGPDPGRHSVRAIGRTVYPATFTAVATALAPRLTADVNGDGTVNIQDLVRVASLLGQAGQYEADVNGDGTVNIQDLVLVAGALGTDASAPAAWHRTSAGVPAREKVEQWLAQAHRLRLTDPRSQRGVFLLEHLLAALTPKETALLANYPNPFNPETWIPYQLAKPGEVTLTIYTVEGSVVHTLDVGYQAAGIYQGKNRAAYWDGRNAAGEPVASGIYFCTLTAGDFTATRKMLIRK